MDKKSTDGRTTGEKHGIKTWEQLQYCIWELQFQNKGPIRTHVNGESLWIHEVLWFEAHLLW